MKKIIIAGIIFVVMSLIIFAGCISVGLDPVPITYYYSENCTQCQQMDETFKNLTNTYGGQFVLTKYDINKEPVRFYNDQIAHNGDGSVPFVIISNLTVNGYSEGVYTQIEYYIIHRYEFSKSNITMHSNNITPE